MDLLIKTFHGLEETLAHELTELGAKDVQILKRAVSCSGDKKFLYTANLHLRTALRILVPIATFRAKDEDELYKQIYKIDWSKYISQKDTFAIDSVAFSEIFTHSRFVSLKSKDAIVDQFRTNTGKRPSIDSENPDISISIHVSNDSFTISLDSSGESLHRRGYRGVGHQAPLNEVLAAGMLKIAGWHKEVPLVDPMCGTGTILIEAAMIACCIPPGYYRKKFGFMNWADYDKMLWDGIKEEAEKRINYPKTNIVGGDNNSMAIDLAKTSTLDMRLNRQVRIVRSNLDEHMPSSVKGGMMITNPPYGERLQKDDLNKFYKQIGTHLKRNYNNYSVWMITSNFEALKHIGLRPDNKVTLYNGPLECKYVNYELFEGTFKDFKAKKNRRPIKKD